MKMRLKKLRHDWMPRHVVAFDDPTRHRVVWRGRVLRDWVST